MLKLLVFDLDGTLVDSRRDLADSVNFALRQAGWPSLPLESIMENVGNGARNLLEDSLADAMRAAQAGGASGDSARPDESIRPAPSAVDAVFSAFVNHYREHCLATTRLYPGADDALRALTGFRKALLTNKPDEPMRRILDGLGIASRFDAALGGDNPFGKKPDPAALRHILKTLEIPPSEAVMIGDGEQDAQAARRAGVRFVGFLGGIGSREALLREAPDAVIETMGDLPRTVAELSLAGAAAGSRTGSRA